MDGFENSVEQDGVEEDQNNLSITKDLLSRRLISLKHPHRAARTDSR